MAKAVLITGGAGFIGCTLAHRLESEGYRVAAMDILHPQVHAGFGRPAALPAHTELWPSDVTSRTDWDAVVRLYRPEIVVHLAAETGTGQSLTEATRHGMVNVVGTTNMLDALTAAGHRPAHIVLASSRAVYGEGEWVTESGTRFYPDPRLHQDLAAGRWAPRNPNNEPAYPVANEASRTLARPTSVYGATKLAQEHICRAWCAANGTALTVLRLQNVYGPGQSPHNTYTGIVTLFVEAARRGQTLDVFEDGQIVRDFVFIDDVCEAFVRAVSIPPDEFRLLDVGSARSTTIWELAALVAKMCGAPGPVVSGRFRDGDVRAAAAEIAMTCHELTWKPSWELEAGLQRLIEQRSASAAG